MMPMQPMFDQSSLPASIQVPAGNKVAMETVGVGEITYECRDKANAAGMTEWVFVGPNAVLNDRSGKQVGKYYWPPATLGVHGWLQTDRHAIGRCPQHTWQLAVSIVQGQPRHGQRHDDRRDPHSAGGTQGRRGTFQHVQPG